MSDECPSSQQDTHTVYILFDSLVFGHAFRAFTTVLVLFFLSYFLRNTKFQYSQLKAGVWPSTGKLRQLPYLP